jgi:putative tryptophan/tyrosine transport system substrate-binding protein
MNEANDRRSASMILRIRGSWIRPFLDSLSQSVFRQAAQGHAALKYLILAGILILSGVSSALGAEMTVAVVKGNSLLPYEEILAGFADGLQQWNVTTAFFPMEEKNDQQTLSAWVARIRPDVILCLDLKALERASPIKHIPKVFSLITAANIEPWSERDDISGILLDIAPAVQFRVMRQAFPEGRRIGVLYDPAHNRKIVEEAKKATAASGFNLQAIPVDTIKEIPLAFEKLEKNIDLLWTLYDPTVCSPEAARYLLMQSLQKRIPVVGFSPQFAKAGALLALSGDYIDMGRQVALQIQSLRNGEQNIARLSRPRTLRVAVNDKVRRFLGVTFPPSFLKTVNQSF